MERHTMFIDILRYDRKKMSMCLYIEHIPKQNPYRIFMKLNNMILLPHTGRSDYYQKDKK